MKINKILNLLLISLFATSLITFTSCDKCDEDNDNDNQTCDTCAVAYKPNIYIYPETKTQLSVNLSFPQGGEVIKSIPEYNTGWTVTVDTTGIIDNQYEYLFYESSQPNSWQRNKAWIVKKDSLKDFFTQNMAKYGFKGREIKDFTDYWVPKLTGSESYAIFPQTAEIIDKLITLNISKKPDNLLRLFYLIQDGNNLENRNISEPKIDTSFKREKYFVTEWGVILK